MIPKPTKDYIQLKGWRPINLINCVGRLEEKVVADELQEAQSFFIGTNPEAPKVDLPWNQSLGRWLGLNRVRPGRVKWLGGCGACKVASKML